MSPPEPMLSCSAHRWPEGGEWVLQPKWDGFRLLIEVDDDRRVRAWSRHGTSLTARLGGLTAAFAEAPPGSVCGLQGYADSSGEIRLTLMIS